MVSTEIDLHSVSPHLLPPCPSHISTLNPNSCPLHTEVDGIFFNIIFKMFYCESDFLPVAYIWYQEDKSVFTRKPCKKAHHCEMLIVGSHVRNSKQPWNRKTQTGSQKNHAKRAWRDRSLRICVLLTFCCTPEHNL